MIDFILFLCYTDTANRRAFAALRIRIMKSIPVKEKENRSTYDSIFEGNSGSRYRIKGDT